MTTPFGSTSRCAASRFGLRPPRLAAHRKTYTTSWDVAVSRHRPNWLTLHNRLEHALDYRCAAAASGQRTKDAPSARLRSAVRCHLTRIHFPLLGQGSDVLVTGEVAYLGFLDRCLNLTDLPLVGFDKGSNRFSGEKGLAALGRGGEDIETVLDVVVQADGHRGRHRRLCLAYTTSCAGPDGQHYESGAQPPVAITSVAARRQPANAGPFPMDDIVGPADRNRTCICRLGGGRSIH